MVKEAYWYTSMTSKGVVGAHLIGYDTFLEEHGASSRELSF